MSLRKYLSPLDMNLHDTRALFEVARDLRSQPLRDAMRGKSLGLVFFNPSLRTRTSFEVGAFQLGGQAVTLEVGSGVWKLEHRKDAIMDGDAAEHIIEAARVLSRYVDVLAVRSFPAQKVWAEDKADEVVGGFAEYATVPVISAESGIYHPCQSLADLLTIEDRLGSATKQPIAITWAWHPKALPMAVPNSILMESAKFGMDIRLAHPPGWELDGELMDTARKTTNDAGGSLTVHHDMDSALRGARVVYAKSWGSIRHYGDAAGETAAKSGYRDAWRVTESRMAMGDDPFFMHCLPVRRNVIVDGTVLDGPRNAAYDEAENRLHVQKALLLKLLGL